MADEFPDPDEEFDLVHEDEYEILREIEGKSCKKQLNFSQTSEVSTAKPTSQRIEVAPIPLDQSQSVNLPTQNGLDKPSTTSNKRTIEDLFGDLKDLIGDEDFQDVACCEPKVKKLCWDQEVEIIKKIVAGRKREADKWKPMNVNSDLPRDSKKDSISMRVPNWNFVAVTRCSDSQRLYIRVKSDSKCTVVKSRPASGLLSVSFSKLKAEAEEIMVNAAKKMSEASGNSELIPAAFGHELWVDKYRPHKYMELLSEEGVNRTFLRWLKLWDKIVFHRDPVRRRIMKTAPKFGDKKKNNTAVEGLDEKGFPVPRIVLLSGPPGLGKTTLAHLAAKHAGYNVIDVNASSDRGTKEFKAALYSATQMKAVMGKNPKPNCLVMDEVDGAPPASIDILLKFIHGNLEEDTDQLPKRKKKKEKKESTGCRRPIICICNDAYAPSLRALRQIALVIPVCGVSAGRLAGRLMEILHRQGLNADPSALVSLAEQSGCDVRACLGALQYMGGIKAGQKVSIAPKDVRRGIFDCWREILQVPRDKIGPMNIKERIQRILQVAYGGETDLLVRGVFHNYPEILFRDEGMETVAAALDWFQLYDVLNDTVMSQQTWNLMPYSNYAFVAWHFAFAGIQNPKLTYPTVENEVNQKLARTNAILRVTRQASGIDKMALVFDLAPLLTDLLTPSLRSVSYHLFSHAEKADLVRLVNVLLDLGLNLFQDKTPEGGYVYNLEPNLEEVGTFPNCRTRRSLTYAVKQILVREIEAARLKKYEVVATAISDSNIKAGASVKPPETRKNSDTPSTPTVPNHLVRLQPITTQVTPESHQYLDFFGRLVVKKSPQNQESTGGQNNSVSPGTRQALSRSDVWFKYKEGYSNAVRRKVRIRDLQ
ncbi:chromosome transmission fidelity protein 18 homolog [Neodiprion virginianus]|uniref:chromosome transmission fidelity protein 18 homolog n=1 Tax=Neodiprion virginianus TaxID=2961670 RepID=UPI001EE6E628|nr:chromosome transmission fidelity protein 18 homolog [Neodiprion virginianus]